MIELELVKNSARRSCTPVSRYLMKITEQERRHGLGNDCIWVRSGKRENNEDKERDRGVEFGVLRGLFWN